MENLTESSDQFYKKNTENEDENENEKRKQKIKFLDEKIIEIIGFLTDANLRKAEKAGVSQDSKEKIKIIKRNVIKLISLINDPEIKIIRNSHLCDRLGNFCGCLGLAERIIQKKKEEKISEELITKFEDQIIRYHNYFSECVMNGDFLKQELETVEGAIIQ